MKILYLSTWDFTNEESDGVCKKIYSQIAVFEKTGYDVDFIYIKDRKIIYRESKIQKIVGKVGNIKKTPAYIKLYKSLKHKKYDWIYNRYGMMDPFYYRVLKRLHKNGARILIEIPTYPYINEIPAGFLYKIMIAWDKIYNMRLKKCVGRIATYSLDDEIFGIKTIKIKNGLDFSSIKIKNKKINNGIIDLIGVAHLSKWHGFDRVIKGLYEYYLEIADKQVVHFHIVGTGEALAGYQKLVKEYKLEDHVFFYGDKSGDELDQIYDQCDIAVSSLGLHRIGVTEQASVLKSREYGAKGMPMISSIEIDAFKADDFKYISYFPEDESPINIDKVVELYKRVMMEKDDIRKIIREYAYEKCDKSVVSLPIINYMKEAENE